MNDYFVRKGIFISDPYQVVKRVPSDLCPHSGLPLSHTLIALPGSYDTFNEAQARADELNEIVICPECGYEDCKGGCVFSEAAAL